MQQSIDALTLRDDLEDGLTESPGIWSHRLQTLDLATARTSLRQAWNGEWLWVEELTGTLQLVINNPGSPQIELREGDVYFGVITQVWVTNTAQTGRTARIFLGTGGFRPPARPGMFGVYHATPQALADGDRRMASLNDDGTLLASSKQDVELVASGARTATGQAAAVSGLRGYNAATFMLDITADESTSADLLDVAIQRLMPNGTTWDTIARFTQALGDAGASKQVIDYVASSAEAARAVDESTSAPTLAAGQSKDTPWGDQLRVIWIIVDDSALASFTFSVTGHFRV